MIHGRDVRLRAIEPGDLEFLAMLADDPQVHSHVVGWSWPLARHGQEAWLQRTAGDTHHRRLMITDVKGASLGMTGFWDVDLQNRSAQSAIKLHGGSIVGRKNTGTDALKTMLAVGFSELGLNRIWAVILDFNQASLALYTRKVGFKIEGVRREEIYRSGAFRDLYHLGILRSEWQAQPDSAEYASRLTVAALDDAAPPGREFWASPER